MKSIGAILLFIFILVTTDKLFAQDHLFYVSIQGTWDKQKLINKAQFGGNNKLINTYFNNFTRELLRSGSDVKGTGEISFVVRADGNVDGLVINKSIGQMYDSTVYKILQSMSGKWRAEQVNGVNTNVTMTIWYNVYQGPKLKKSLEEYIAEGKESIVKSDFKKALKNADNALEYDALNVEAIIIKTKALTNLNQREQACEFITLTHKYNNVRLIDAEK